MNGFKFLIFGLQLIIVGIFVDLRLGVSSRMFIMDRPSDMRLAIILVIIGLVVSFFGLRKTD